MKKKRKLYIFLNPSEWKFMNEVISESSMYRRGFRKFKSKIKKEN